MISFHTIRWKNFLSTGDSFTEIKLDTKEKTLFIGKNGAGKSTILDALAFSLFGRPYRKINKPALVNSINKKKLVTEIEFSTNGSKYKVIRGIKPNLFEVYCNGKLLNQEAQIRDQQEHLEKFILKMNYKSFVQLVTLGSASFTPFMQLTPADRRIVIEEILDIEVFSVMNAIVKKRYSDSRSLLEQNRIEITSKENHITYIEKSIESLKDINKKKVDKLKKEYEEEKGKSEKIKEEILSLEADRNALQESLKTENGDISACLRKKHSSLISLKSRLDTTQCKHEKDISFYKQNDNCPTCLQDINDEFKKEIIAKDEKKIDEISVAIKEIDQKIDDVLTKISEVDRVLSDISTLDQKILVANQKYKNILDKMSSLVNQVPSDNSDNMLNDSKEECKKSKSELKKLYKDREELSKQKQLLEIAGNLLKDTGIKTRIIKQYLPITNTLINKYLSLMGFFINFHIDENFEETIKSRYLDVFTYNNFSEGEKFRIDLAVLLAWRTIAKMKNSVNCNIVFFDEIFDGSLDTTGTDDFVKIMSQLEDDLSVFVISHKQDQLIDKFDKVISFSKKKNFSVMKEN